MYEPHGIFSEGWTLQIGEETTIRASKPRESARSVDGKQKEESTCGCCGKSFHAMRGAKGRFCSYNCMYEDKKAAMERLRPCMSCHAELGMTGAASGRMINMNKAKVCTYRKTWGLKTLTNSEARIGQQIKVHGRIPWWGGIESGIAWMSQTKTKDFDWSILWRVEVNRRKALNSPSAYSKMTNEQRHERNKKTWEKKKKLWTEDPSKRPSPEKRTEYAKTWKNKNREKNREYQKKALKKRKSIDPGFRVQCNLRHRLKEIMGKVKKGGTEHRNNLTGCTTKQLAAHLEVGFKRGMTWENYGTKWHVDHIIPCASFDHTDSNQRVQCWHWTNLRALDAKRNMEKSDTITEPQMALLLCAV